MACNLDIFEYRDYLRKRYGEVLYRIPVDTGASCPNRGADGSGGCTFCGEDGSRAAQLGEAKDLGRQLELGVRFAERRYKANAFMAYLQAFTCTFQQVELLDAQVRQILGQKGIRAITFGTRPDCLTPKVLDYLQTLQQRVDVWVELGVQSIHDTTLARINRGHDWQCSKRAIQELERRGLSCAVHLILGLPGETVDDMRASIDAVCSLPVLALKLHNLHIVKDTRLAEEFAAAPFPVYDEHSYCELLLELLPFIPAGIAIIRLNTDTAEDRLVAPRWSMSKGQFRRFLARQMRARNVVQGQAVRGRHFPVKAAQLKTSSAEPVTTDDGSITFYNAAIKEHYHSLAGARSEAEKTYINPGRLVQRLHKRKIRLLDICFGLGYNSLLACERCLEIGGRLDITALEMDTTVVEQAARRMIMPDAALNWKACLRALVDSGRWSEKGCSIRILWGDARYTVGTLSGVFDLIWLDAFSSQRNSELWTVDFFRKLSALLAVDGALLTYSAAIPVRSGLLQAGFFVGKTEPFGKVQGGTIATLDPRYISRHLSEKERSLIASRRGTPYRDPSGTRTNREILRAREYEIVQRKYPERLVS